MIFNFFIMHSGHIYDREGLEPWIEQQYRPGQPAKCLYDQTEFSTVTPRPDLKERIYNFIKENPDLFPDLSGQTPEEALAASQRARQEHRESDAHRAEIREVVRRNIDNLEKNPANFSGNNIWAKTLIARGTRFVTFYVPSQSAPLFSSEPQQGESLFLKVFDRNHPCIISYPVMSFIQPDEYIHISGSTPQDGDLTPHELLRRGFNPLDDNVWLQQAVTDRSPTGYRLPLISMINDFYIPVDGDLGFYPILDLPSLDLPR
jgi:hypothetical protein